MEFRRFRHRHDWVRNEKGTSPVKLHYIWIQRLVKVTVTTNIRIPYLILRRRRGSIMRLCVIVGIIVNEDIFPAISTYASLNFIEWNQLWCKMHGKWVHEWYIVDWRWHGNDWFRGEKWFYRNWKLASNENNQYYGLRRPSVKLQYYLCVQGVGTKKIHRHTFEAKKHSHKNISYHLDSVRAGAKIHYKVRTQDSKIVRPELEGYA